MQLGFSNAAGQQCTQVCGINAPYRNKNHVDLAEHRPQLLADIQKNLDFMWGKLKTLYPEEARNMLETSDELRFGSTGFVKVSVATNFDADWHIDQNNQRNGIQALLVLGEFEGGDVCLDPAGRTGKLRQVKTSAGQRETIDETKSKGSDSIIIIKNAHGTFFCGSYKSIWHSVKPILNGNRTIIAAYCREDLAKFDRTARRRYGIRTAIRLHDERLAAIRYFKRVHPEHAACPKGNCKCGLVKLLRQLKSDWKQIDLLPIVVCDEKADDDEDVEMHCADVVPEPANLRDEKADDDEDVEMANEDLIVSVAQKALHAWLPNAMHRTMAGLALIHDGAGCPEFQRYLKHFGKDGKLPYVPSFFRGLDSGGLLGIGQVIPAILAEAVDDQERKRAALIASYLLCEIDLDICLEILDELKPVLGKHVDTVSRMSAIKRALIGAKNRCRSTSGRRRYQTLAFDSPKPQEDTVLSVLAQLEDNQELFDLMDSNCLAFGKCISKVKGIGALKALDVSRTLQLLSTESRWLLQADQMPTRLSPALGAFKNIAPLFEEISPDKKKPSVHQVEKILREMQQGYKEVAQQIWSNVINKTPMLRKWTPAMQVLYFRHATIMDVEMMACEHGKIKSGQDWKAGKTTAKGRRITPKKGYFEINRDWPDHWTVRCSPMLARVRICRLKEGEAPGGTLEAVCVDLRPVAVRDSVCV